MDFDFQGLWPSYFANNRPDIHGLVIQWGVSTMRYTTGFVSIVSLGILLIGMPTIVLADEIAQLRLQVEALAQNNETLQALVTKQQKETAANRERLTHQQTLTQQLLSKIEVLEIRAASASERSTTTQGHQYNSGFLGGILPQSVTTVADIDLRIFPTFGFKASTEGDDDKSTFQMGSTTFIFTSEVFDRVQFLLESVFSFNTSTNASGWALQRLHAGYEFSDYFKLKFGRMHTALGYWNQSFHHGGWVQTSIERPEIYGFEVNSSGGYLPIHSIGLEFSGRLPLGPMDGEYALGILNGRGRTVTEITHLQDKNDSKAVSLLVSLLPHAIDGLKFGPLLYLDTIPSNPSDVKRTERIKELILGAHATYSNDPIRLSWEFFNVQHDDKTSGQHYDGIGTYLQGEYRLTDTTTPYYRFDYIDAANGDPFLTGERAIDRTKHTLGLRWDPFTWNAIKFEYSYLDRRTSKNEHALTLNSAFVF